MHERRLPWHTRTVVRAALLALVGAVCAPGCGSAEHVVIGDRGEAGEAGATQFEVTSGVNVCPHFESSLIMPQRIGPDETAMLNVHAGEPDAPDAELRYVWSAPSGSFSERDKPQTGYHCGALGSQRLTVTATDGFGCSTALTIDVECLGN